MGVQQALSHADRRLRGVSILLGFLILSGRAQAHPANIPVARAKVTTSGAIEFSITFDVLAFLLDQTPTTVLDAPMNALLDGPADILQRRLDAGKVRFLEGLSIADGGFSVEKSEFPSATDLQRISAKGHGPRLPLMATATMRFKLLPGVKQTTFRFADVLGTVVLTTEMPYEEPVSEPVEPGSWSSALGIPTEAESAALAASMSQRPIAVAQRDSIPEESARQAIQAKYDAWSRAYMAHDVTTLLSILTSDYTLKTAKGALIKRSEYEVMLKLRKQKHSDTTHYSTEIQRMTLRNGVAAIYSHETTTDSGINDGKGGSGPTSYQHDYIDVWVFGGSGWRLRSTVTQRETLLAPAK